MSNIDPTVTEPKIETTTQEQGTTEPIKNVEVNNDYLDDLYKDHPQVLEKWIKDNVDNMQTVTSWKDSYVSQGINTFKEKTLPQIESDIRTKIIKELNPPKSPYEEKVIEIESKMKEAERKAHNAEVRARGANYISEIGFDLGGIMSPNDFAKGSEEDTVMFINRIRDFAKYNEEKGKKSFIKDNNYNPPSGESDAVPYGGSMEKYNQAIKEGKAKFDQKVIDKINAYVYGKNRR